MANGADTGNGCSLAQIEANPPSFFTDNYTAMFVAGTVRGQLSAVPMGGVDAGAGGTATGADAAAAPTAIGIAALAAASGSRCAACRMLTDAAAPDVAVGRRRSSW